VQRVRFLVTEYLPTKKQLKATNVREKKIEKEKFLVSVKCGSGTIFHTTVTVTVGENAHGVSVTQTASTQ
jgi:hypothetical protein